jgi:ribosomal-protein-alanine N-acetyltransferase
MARAEAVGEACFLRAPVAGDRGEYVALRRASRAHLEPWEPAAPPGFDPYGDDAFDRDLKRRRTATERRWLICEKRTGAIAGRITISAIERGPFQNGRLGYWIGAAFARRGLMTEAIGLVLGLAFSDPPSGLGLHRVEANIMPRNVASRRAVERNGLRLVGESPDYLQIAGAWEAHGHWAITAEAWAARRGDQRR